MAITAENLKKIPNEPAARLLAKANVKLDTKTDAPASASVGDLLSELEAAGAHVDMLYLLAAVLPPREAVWWACLAADDVLSRDGLSEVPTVTAAKAWVREPDADRKEAARVAVEAAETDDETVYCALAAFYGDGTITSADQLAPPGAVAGAVFAQNMVSINSGETFAEDIDHLIARAMDIAAGGNGRISRPFAGGEGA